LILQYIKIPAYLDISPIIIITGKRTCAQIKKIAMYFDYLLRIK